MASHAAIETSTHSLESLNRALSEGYNTNEGYKNGAQEIFEAALKQGVLKEEGAEQSPLRAQVLSQAAALYDIPVIISDSAIISDDTKKIPSNRLTVLTRGRFTTGPKAIAFEFDSLADGSKNSDGLKNIFKLTMSGTELGWTDDKRIMRQIICARHREDRMGLFHMAATIDACLLALIKDSISKGVHQRVANELTAHVNDLTGIKDMRSAFSSGALLKAVHSGDYTELVPEECTPEVNPMTRQRRAVELQQDVRVHILQRRI